LVKGQTIAQQPDLQNRYDLKSAHYKWVEIALQTDDSDKENKWTQSIVVGSKTLTPK
jgi:hypothetical protein